MLLEDTKDVLTMFFHSAVAIPQSYPALQRRT